MKTFEMLEGYDDAYETVLRAGLEALDNKAIGGGLDFKEDNMRFQLKQHLGIKVDLPSQQKQEEPKAKDIGVENYN